jgi:hypothetical protein
VAAGSGHHLRTSLTAMRYLRLLTVGFAVIAAVQGNWAGAALFAAFALGELALGNAWLMRRVSPAAAGIALFACLGGVCLVLGLIPLLDGKEGGGSSGCLLVLVGLFNIGIAVRGWRFSFSRAARPRR